jgi:hypothetical protein
MAGERAAAAGSKSERQWYRCRTADREMQPLLVWPGVLCHPVTSGFSTVARARAKSVFRQAAAARPDRPDPNTFQSFLLPSGRPPALLALFQTGSITDLRLELLLPGLILPPPRL